MNLDSFTPGNASRFLGFLLLSQFLWAHLSIADAQIEIVRAEGFARGSGPQVRLAAEQNAAEEAIYLWLVGEVGELPREAIYPLIEYSDRYVQTSRLKREKPERGGLLVEVDAYLDTELLRADAATVLFPLLPDIPRVVIVVTEQYPGEVRATWRPDGIVTEKLEAKFRVHGFEVVSQEELGELYSPTELSGRIRDGTESMGLLAKEFRADVAVYGTASCLRIEEEDVPNAGRVGSRVELRAVGAREKYMCEWVRAEAELNSVDIEIGKKFVLDDACQKIERHLVVAGIFAAYAQGNEADGLLISVDDVPGAEWGEQMARFLSKLESVSEVETLRAGAGRSQYLIQHEGKVVALVDVLLDVQMGEYYLELEQAVQDDIRFNLIKGTKPRDSE